MALLTILGRFDCMHLGAVCDSVRVNSAIYGTFSLFFSNSAILWHYWKNKNE